MSEQQPSASSPGPRRLAMTLDIHEEHVEEYIKHHDNSRPEIESALRSVGLRNLSLWVWGSRMFYYEEPFEEAMVRYAKMPRVQEWETLMDKYQKRRMVAGHANGVSSGLKCTSIGKTSRDPFLYNIFIAPSLNKTMEILTK